MKLISLDPGANECYLCRWEDSQLLSVHVVQDPYSYDCDLAICEQMQVRRGGAYSDDLLNVSKRAGRVLGLVPEHKILWVVPSDWKGNVPKDIHQRTRILPLLTPEDHAKINATVPRKSLRHNAYDAFGIGAWWLRSKGLWRR